MMKRTLRSHHWGPTIAAFAAFGALGGTGAYWALQLFAPPVAIAPAGSLVDTRSAPDLVTAQALFGSADSAAVPLPGLNIRVIGVAASPARGSAVLVVDSKAAKAFLVGDDVGDGLRLVEVRPDAAILERKGVRIELPAPQRPTVALLSSGPGSAPSPPDTAIDREAARTRADDPAIEATTLSPQGAPAADPAQFSGIRASSTRTARTPTQPNEADAAPDGATR